MYEIMSSDEAIRLIRDGDCICVNSFVGIESPVELHEALYRRYQRMQSPRHLTVISSAGFGVWDENRNAEGYIREGAVDRLICGHFGAMIGAASVYDMANQFDLYDNGGFANITAKTPTVVFRLTPKGLKLIEVYPGVDMEKDILAQLPFAVEI